jgi:hypothetical protein
MHRSRTKVKKKKKSKTGPIQKPESSNQAGSTLFLEVHFSPELFNPARYDAWPETGWTVRFDSSTFNSLIYILDFVPFFYTLFFL